MANSPGPSTSKPSETDPENKKKKRTRRKPRTRSKPDSELIPLKFDFQMPPPAPRATTFKQKRPPGRPINLESFITNGRIRTVFLTKLPGWEPSSPPGLLQSVAKLTINGVCQASTKKTDGKRKKRKKKDEKNFPEYLGENEVKLGLENGELMKGYIRINPKNCKECYVGNEDTTKSDYVISGIVDRNRAFDGDEVVLRVKAETEEKKKLMEVVYINKKVLFSCPLSMSI